MMRERQRFSSSLRAPLPLSPVSSDLLRPRGRFNTGDPLGWGLACQVPLSVSSTAVVRYSWGGLLFAEALARS
jgi:hypothetical protein